jgi:hypothetical protein
LRYPKRNLSFLLAPGNFDREIQSSERFRTFEPEILSSRDLDRVAAS